MPTFRGRSVITLLIARQAMKLPNDKEARYADEHKMLDILENMKTYNTDIHNTAKAIINLVAFFIVNT